MSCGLVFCVYYMLVIAIEFTLVLYYDSYAVQNSLYNHGMITLNNNISFHDYTKEFEQHIIAAWYLLHINFR